MESAAAGVRAAGLGANLIRLRAPLLSVREQERELEQLVGAVEAPVVVTSRIDLALATGAAGVHLVEGDVPVGEVHRVAPTLLIGCSVHSVGAAASAAQDGASYVVFGPVWATPSHPEARGVGLDALRAAALATRPVPVLGVGGIDASRTERVMRAGAAGWAAIRMYA